MVLDGASEVNLLAQQGVNGLAQPTLSACLPWQVPVLFTGSMRSNLDPFSRHSDDECWEALERSHLSKMVQVRPCLGM